jgi:DNA-3-methyladenine glycosylase II
MSTEIHRHFVKTARAVSPPLHAAIAATGALTFPRRGGKSLAWFLARVIVGQQLSTSAARSIWARVEAAAKMEGAAIPEFFVERNTRKLRACGLSRAKTKALLAIRTAQADGALSIRRLRKLNHAARSEVLQEIWGVGQWTADMTSIFYFTDPDVWPEGDVAVQGTLRRLTGKRSHASAFKIAAAFAPYRSFLALYMWRILDGGTPPARGPVDSKRPV